MRRHRLEVGISKEEEEKPRSPILQEWDGAAIVLSNHAHQLCGTQATDRKSVWPPPIYISLGYLLGWSFLHSWGSAIPKGRGAV